jgi:hypothetical protein
VDGGAAAVMGDEGTDREHGVDKQTLNGSILFLLSTCIPLLASDVPLM